MVISAEFFLKMAGPSPELPVIPWSQHISQESRMQMAESRRPRGDEMRNGTLWFRGTLAGSVVGVVVTLGVRSAFRVIVVALGDSDTSVSLIVDVVPSQPRSSALPCVGHSSAAPPSSPPYHWHWKSLCHAFRWAGVRRPSTSMRPASSGSSRKVVGGRCRGVEPPGSLRTWQPRPQRPHPRHSAALHKRDAVVTFITYGLSNSRTKSASFQHSL